MQLSTAVCLADKAFALVLAYVTAQAPVSEASSCAPPHTVSVESLVEGTEGAATDAKCA